MAQASAAANRILSARLRPNLHSPKPVTMPKDNGGGATIELQDVHFKYPTRDISVFEGLSLTVSEPLTYATGSHVHEVTRSKKDSLSPLSVLQARLSSTSSCA